MDGPFRAPGRPAGPPCPRCPGEVLAAREVGPVTVEECPGCGGVFVRHDILDEITVDLGLQVTVRETFPAGPLGALPPGPLYIRCPRCAGLMNRRLFAAHARVVVDQCARDGTWFDARELPAVVAFIEAGGLERARAEAAAARAREAARPAPMPMVPAGHEPADERSLLDVLALLLGWLGR